MTATAGQYISDIKARVVAAYSGDLSALSRDEAQEVFRASGVDFMFGDIKASLHDFGVDFDVYFHENELHDSRLRRSRGRATARARAHLRERRRDLAAHHEFGDDKDRVVIKSDGEAAYISGDLAYYLNKRERGFERNLIMLGADHHGYVKRLMAMTAAFGDTPGFNLEIMIGQMVNLLRNGEPVRMSKRAGTVVTLEDLVEAVGVDAGRYALVRSSTDSQLDIDLDLLGRRTNDNPVYLRAVRPRAHQLGREQCRRRGCRPQCVRTRAAHSRDREQPAGHPGRVSRGSLVQAAELREPHRIARYLEELAGAYHRWYDNCRVTPLGDEPVSDLHRTRLWLNDATGQVLRNGLGLLGVSAPARM